ncbi:GNAT family N-acetyltransferase [Georgenia faecalis]|uniref:GNAT family N-acetyltransferase n=1 Tax=Georgenia faecalis TaxID=2483799 RepID=A0ABV9D573_9MICO|nr:GNAT family N-acetyltransferase [Georgenia faecalis]
MDLMTEVARVDLARTEELSAGARRACRDLLVDVFGDDFGEADWHHCLGGRHVLLRVAGELVGHGAVVERQLHHGGRRLRAGYVEGLAVRADHRGHGHGAALMVTLEALIRSRYDAGVLSTTEAAAGFYAARGWSLWRGPSSVVTPTGVETTPDDDGGIYVLPVRAALDLDGEITCDWREGDVW